MFSRFIWWLQNRPPNLKPLIKPFCLRNMTIFVIFKKFSENKDLKNCVTFENLNSNWARSRYSQNLQVFLSNMSAQINVDSAI